MVWILTYYGDPFLLGADLGAEAPDRREGHPAEADAGQRQLQDQLHPVRLDQQRQVGGARVTPVAPACPVVWAAFRPPDPSNAPGPSRRQRRDRYRLRSQSRSVATGPAGYLPLLTEQTGSQSGAVMADRSLNRPHSLVVCRHLVCPGGWRRGDVDGGCGSGRRAVSTEVIGAQWFIWSTAACLYSVYGEDVWQHHIASHG